MITAFEGMHLHLEARARSFPAESRPDHRYPDCSVNGSCCDGSYSACGYARPCLAPFALHDEDTCWCLPRPFFFPRGSLFFFSTYVFQMFFFQLLLRRQQKGQV